MTSNSTFLAPNAFKAALASGLPQVGHLDFALQQYRRRDTGRLGLRLDSDRYGARSQ